MAAWRFGVTSLGAWVAAAVWLLLPLTGELAAYAKARADELVLVGVLLAAIAATGRWWRGWALVGIVAGGIVAVGAKQAGVVVLLLVPFWTSYLIRVFLWKALKVENEESLERHRLLSVRRLVLLSGELVGDH